MTSEMPLRIGSFRSVDAETERDKSVALTYCLLHIYKYVQYSVRYDSKNDTDVYNSYNMNALQKFGKIILTL